MSVLSVEKCQQNLIKNFYKIKPICVICENQISRKDIAIKNFVVSIPKHNFYRIIYCHKSCINGGSNGKCNDYKQ